MTPNSTERAQAESRPTKCPICQLPIWGEGWNPANGERFYSHRVAGGCCFEIGILPDGTVTQRGIGKEQYRTPSLGTCGAPVKEESGRPGWIQELRRLAENALGDPHKIVPRMEIPICALNARATPVRILDLIDQLAAAEKRVAELEHTNHTSIDLFAQELGKRLAAEERCAELENAVRKVVDTFKRDEADGYRSRSREYAITILEPALTAASLPGGAPLCTSDAP